MSVSTFLNGGSATQLRGLAWLALSETGTVLAGSVVSDGGGGGTLTFGTTASVPCRIDPIQGTPGGLVAGRIDERSTHIVTVPSHTALTEASQFAITGRGTYEVTALQERTAEQTTIFEVIEAS